MERRGAETGSCPRRWTAYDKRRLAEVPPKGAPPGACGAGAMVKRAALGQGKGAQGAANGENCETGREPSQESGRESPFGRRGPSRRPGRAKRADPGVIPA